MYNASEALFYRFAQSPTSSVPSGWDPTPVSQAEAAALRDLAAFLPRFHGSASIESENGTVASYVQLEDIVHGFRRPCVLDIKMGRRQRKFGASPAKRRRQIEKSFSTTSHALGFRLCGCQVYDVTRDVWTFRDKYACRRLPRDDIDSGLRDHKEQSICSSGCGMVKRTMWRSSRVLSND